MLGVTSEYILKDMHDKKLIMLQVRMRLYLYFFSSHAMTIFQVRLRDNLDILFKRDFIFVTFF